MKAIKKVRKGFNKVTKTMGFNRVERRRVKKVVKNMAYDTAVNVASTICVDAVYTVADLTVTGVGMAVNKVKSLVAAKNTDTENTEENEA